MAIYAWSDLHVDYPLNLELVTSLDPQQYQQDTLLLAGDISDRLERLETVFKSVSQVFRHVFFVPGNHELWLRKSDFPDSIKKFHYLQEMCHRYGIHTKAKRIEDPLHPAWVVPLYSWYSKHDEGDDSLYIEKTGEDKSLRMWMDNHRITWPDALNAANGLTPNAYFLQLNQTALCQYYDAPVISFSHFLPRQELIFPGKVPTAPIPPFAADPHPTFNFSSVAGTYKLFEQIKQLGSHTHIYGHQHRNKIRYLDGVQFVSHCLGYPNEPRVAATGDRKQPLQVWPEL